MDTSRKGLVRAYPAERWFLYSTGVTVKHDDGTLTLCAHLSQILVGPSTVEAGDKIRLAGSTGRSTGNHLHLGWATGTSWADFVGKNGSNWRQRMHNPKYLFHENWSWARAERH